MDPFRLLKVSKDVSKREIITAAALALRERKFSAREIAEAQRALLNPQSRAANTFLHFINMEPLFSAGAPHPFTPEKSVEIKRLGIFDKK